MKKGVFVVFGKECVILKDIIIVKEKQAERSGYLFFGDINEQRNFA